MSEEGISTWAKAKQVLRRESLMGAAVTLGGTPVNQFSDGMTQVGFMGGAVDLHGDGSIGRIHETGFSQHAPGGKMGVGMGVFAGGTTLLSMGIGFSQHGLMGAAGMLGTDIAVSAASTRALPKIVNASGKVRYATNAMSMMGSFAGPALGSVAGGIVGSIGGAPGLYAGQMAGAYAGGAMQAAGVNFLHDAASRGYKKAGGTAARAAGRSAVAGMGTGMRLAARHPLATFAAAGTAVALTAGYATYKSAQFGMAGLVAGARFRRNRQMINTAGDLAAFTSGRSATAAQMAHRHRAALGMQINEAYGMTATRYHHSQRVFK